MKLFFLIFILFTLLPVTGTCARATAESFFVCPLCSMDGIITCPIGFEAACADQIPNITEPKCVFLENKYVPGCWKFVGIKKLDLNFNPSNMPPSFMIDIIGGGETYTVDREAVGCRKL